MFHANLVLGLKAEISKYMFYPFFRRKFVDDDFVADGCHRLCARALADFVQNEFCWGLCALEHGDFDKFMRGKGIKYVVHLIVPYAVLSNLKDWI